MFDKKLSAVATSILVYILLNFSITEGHKWVYVTYPNDEIPCEDAAYVGLEQNGYYVYLARLRYFNNVFPGNHRRGAWTPYGVLNGTHYEFNQAEVLCGYDYVWHHVKLSNDSNTQKLLTSAIPVGYQDDGEILYACRAIQEWTALNDSSIRYGGGLHVGTIDSNTMECITSNSTGSIFHHDTYELLVTEPTEADLQAPQNEYYWTVSTDGVTTCKLGQCSAGVNPVYNWTTYHEYRVGSIFGRAHIKGNLLPAFYPSNSTGNIVKVFFDGLIYMSDECDVLCGSGFGWQPVNMANNTALPEAALPVGFFENGDYSYACRTTTPTPWKEFLTGVIDPNSYLCNVTYTTNGTPNIVNEITHTSEYEVLIRSPTIRTSNSTNENNL